jgi:hypothetical protein
MTGATRVDDRLDRWVRRLTLGAVLSLAATMLGIGIALYSPQEPAPGTRRVDQTDIQTRALPRE